MQKSRLARRRLIFAPLAFAGTSSLLRLPASAAGTLPPTARQTPGPFYPLSLPQDADNDLVHVSGHQGTAQGRITKITGRILDLNGRSVPGEARFGNAMPTASIITSGITVATRRMTRISRATAQRSLTRAAGISFSRSSRCRIQDGRRTFISPFREAASNG